MYTWSPHWFKANVVLARISLFISMNFHKRLRYIWYFQVTFTWIIICFSSQNTWEPVEHLNCPDLIKKYEDSVKKQKRGRGTSEEKKKKSYGPENNADGTVLKKESGVSILRIM